MRRPLVRIAGLDLYATMFSWFKKSTSVAPADGLLATKADQKGVKPQFHALTVREVRRETSDSV